MTWNYDEHKSGKGGDSSSTPKAGDDTGTGCTSGRSPIHLSGLTEITQGQHVEQESTDYGLASQLQGSQERADLVDLGNNEANENRKKATPESLNWLVNQDLLQRDNEAVAYSRSLLLEGDTLIYISYPPSSKWFDQAGVETSVASFRVRSKALLDTRSKVFADLLGPTQQFRIQRRKKLIGHLPEGVKYVLDLTPPEEGDEAVELTSELSCSLGVRLWYTTEYRMSILHSLVGGEDALTLAQRFELLSPVIKGHTFHNRGTGDMGHETHINSGSLNQKSRSLDSPVIGPKAGLQRTIRGNEYADHDVGFDIDKSPQDTEEDLQYAIELSKSLMTLPKVPLLREVPDYCPIRHRDGIVRLLQVIEGKDPTLDSAPKVWTLYALAKYFDCTSTMVDLVLAWLMADLNTQFIEILPEATATMAFGLQNAMMARTSFSILVSEEALSLASRLSGHFEADRNGVSQFGRIREDIDEDLRTRIEYGSKTFHDRVNTVFQTLVDKNMLWFQNLPEYQKIVRFEHNTLLRDPKPRNFESWQHRIRKLMDNLRHYIRGQIIRAAVAKLGVKKRNEANLRRKKEQYKSNSSQPSFDVVYGKLTPDERIFTRYFWENLQELTFGCYEHDTSVIGDDDNYTLLARAYEIAIVTTRDLYTSNNAFNLAVISDTVDKCISNGIAPSKAVTGTTIMGGAASPSPYPRSPVSRCPADELRFDVSPTRSDPQPLRVNNKTVHFGEDSEIPARPKCYPQECSDVPSIIPEAPGRNGIAEMTTPNIISSSISPKEVVDISEGEPIARTPTETAIASDSVFFSVNDFFIEAKDYIATICRQMLNTSEMRFDIMLTDTLLCLSAEEFKYLPLWAGGDDDGTGGVFDEAIPMAIAGPSGPGPEFHTGYSNAGSVASGSEFNGDAYEIVSLRAGSSLVNTSVAVDDGYSDNIGDRRNVVVDSDGIQSETFSEDTSLYNGVQWRDKGKAVDRSSRDIAVAGDVPSSGLSDAMWDIDVSDSATEVNPDVEDPNVVENSASAVATGAEEITIDGEIDWNSEEETFDYGDDEEMCDI